MRKTLAVIPLNAEIGPTVNPVIHPSSQELVEIISKCHKNNLATILLFLKSETLSKIPIPSQNFSSQIPQFPSYQMNPAQVQAFTERGGGTQLL